MKTLAEYPSKTGNYNFNSKVLPSTINENIFVPKPVETGKKSFLVFKHNKYMTVSIEKIAFFCIKNETSVITCFDGQEFCVNYSLDHIQNALSGIQFYRLNRQYLINFNAVKDVEHYFARKLLVRLLVPVAEKMLVSKEKASSFLSWLENR